LTARLKSSLQGVLHHFIQENFVCGAKSARKIFHLCLRMEETPHHLRLMDELLFQVGGLWSVNFISRRVLHVAENPFETFVISFSGVLLARCFLQFSRRWGEYEKYLPIYDGHTGSHRR